MASNKIQGLHVEITGDVSGLRKALYEAEKEANRTQDALKLIGKSIKLDPKNIESYATKQGLLTRSISETATALEKEKADMKKLQDEGADPLSKEYVQLQTRITELNKRLEEQVKELNVLSPQMQAYLAKLEGWGNKLEDVGKKTRAFSTAMKSVATASVKSAMEYEEATASIRKVVKDLSDDTVNDLKQLAVDTGTAFSDLAEYATIAGTLGLAENEIGIFTKVMNDLNTATDGSIFGEDGAKKVARFMNVMHESISDVDRFGSALVYVSDHFAATADEVLDVSSGLSGLGALAGVTSGDLVGLAVELKNLGVGTAVASSSIQKVMLQIEKDVVGNTDNFRKFAKVSGMTAEEFAKQWSERPVEAFLHFVDGLKDKTILEINDAVANGSDKLDHYAEVLGMTRSAFIEAWNTDNLSILEQYVQATEELDEETASASGILNDLGISSVRVLGTMLKLAGHGNEVRDAISDFNMAWEENVALGDKANTMYETTSRQIKGTMEAIKQAGADLGEVFLPYVEKGANEIKKLAKAFKESNPLVKNLIASFVVFGATLSPVAIGLGKTFKAISAFGNAIGTGSKILKLANAFNELGKAQKTLETIQKAHDYVDLAEYATAERRISELTETTRVLGEQVGKTGTSVGKFASKFSGLGVTAVGASVALLAVFGAWAKHKDAFEGNMEAFESYRQSLEGLTETAEESFSTQDKQLQLATAQKAKVEELIGSLKDYEKGSEGYKTVTQEIFDGISKVNEALGGNYIYYDEETGQLKMVEDQARLTAQSYDDLADSIRISAWLEAHKEQYIEAVRVAEKANQDINNSYDKYLEERTDLTAKEYDALLYLQQRYQGEAIENLDRALEGFSMEEIGIDSEKIFGIYETWGEYVTTVENSKPVIEDASRVIGNYEMVQDEYLQGRNDVAETFIDLISKGGDLATDQTEAIDKLQKTYKKYQEAMKDGNTEMAEKYKELHMSELEYLDTLGLSVDNHGKIIDRVTGETLGCINLFAEEAQRDFEIVNTAGVTSAQGIEDEFYYGMVNTKKDIEEAKKKAEELDNFQYKNKSFTTTEHRITVFEEVWKGIQGSVSSAMNARGSGGFGSGGFGTERILNNFRRAMQGMQLSYASGGYNVTVNNTFSVNALDRTQAMRFSETIINQVDESLGRRLR